MFQSRLPADFRLFCQKRKCLVRGEKKLVTDIRGRLHRKVVRLIVQITIRFWSNNVSTPHRDPGLFNRSSSRRCFSSQ
jgi:hypothetical protein